MILSDGFLEHVHNYHRTNHKNNYMTDHRNNYLTNHIIISRQAKVHKYHVNSKIFSCLPLIQ